MIKGTIHVCNQQTCSGSSVLLQDEGDTISLVLDSCGWHVHHASCTAARANQIINQWVAEMFEGDKR